jgi:hypothetical protein
MLSGLFAAGLREIGHQRSVGMGGAHPGDITFHDCGGAAWKVSSDALPLSVTAEATPDMPLVGEQPRPKCCWVCADTRPRPGACAKARIHIAEHPPAMLQVLPEMRAEEDEPECLVQSTSSKVVNRRSLWIK